MITTNSTSAESLKMATGTLDTANGSAGLADHVPGQATTVSGMAAATGGINAGSFLESDIDDQLFQFNREDAPLMNLMLRAKRVQVNSPEVDHYMIDEPSSTVKTIAQCGGDRKMQVPLPLATNEQLIPRTNCTLLVKGVDGFDSTGKETPGRNLMLFVTGSDPMTGNPVVRAVNGKRQSSADESPSVPVIPAGTEIVILANSLYETQKEVDPDMVFPVAKRIYLQKRGMNQVVSDYFESQRKRIPFSKAILAEQAITNFKVRGNRTLWASRGSKFRVSVEKMGLQNVYTTEGVRWQICREMQAPVKWSVDSVIALAKMFFTGEDVPRSAILLAGKDLLEAIQKIDYSKHPEIQITTKTNPVGWTVTNFHTVFGDIEVKREPTLDSLGWSKSGALIGDNRLVHYVYSAEHTFEDRVEGQEATRNGVLIWDALALKGTCHIWIDGEGDSNPEVKMRWRLWEKNTAPTAADLAEADIIYLTVDCPAISADAKKGQLWQATVADGAVTFAPYSGSLAVV